MQRMEALKARYDTRAPHERTKSQPENSENSVKEEKNTTKEGTHTEKSTVRLYELLAHSYGTFI